MAEIRHSVCALDCPDCCSLLVTVRGRPRHPAARQSRPSRHARIPLRQSGAVSGARVSPDRLLYPQRRIGAKGEGRFERISWDEALDTIAARLRAVADEFGPEAILPYSYAGTMGLAATARGMDRRFFHRLGASRLDRTICSAAGGAGLTRGARLPLRHRARAVPPLETDPRLGREHSRHQRAPLAVHRGSAAQRREALHHRPAPQPHRRGLPTSISSSTPAAIPRWRSAMMHVIIGESLHDADYVARYTDGFDGAARARARNGRRSAPPH